MNKAGRRRKSTLEFFLAVEALGAAAADHSPSVAAAPAKAAVRHERRKCWPIAKHISASHIGSVVFKEPLLLTASAQGSPIAIATCIGYATGELDSKGHSASGDLFLFLPGLDDLCRSKKSESYKHLLVLRSVRPSRSSGQDSDLSSFSSISSASSSDHDAQGRLASDRYDPLFLDDPDLTTGRHRTIVNLSGIISSVLHYADEEVIKVELNEQFRQMHPYIDPSLSLSKIRHLKKALLAAAMECDLELATVAMSYVLFEKLVLFGHVVKANRRLCGACCLLLSAKACDCRERDLQRLLQALSAGFRLPSSDIVRAEFSIFVALSFSVHVPPHEYLPHFDRIFMCLKFCNFQEYLGERMYNLWAKDS